MQIVLFGLGFLAGIVTVVFIFRLFLIGTLRIDTSDPQNEPLMFLELFRHVDDISKKQYVVMKVSTQNYIPRK